MVRFKKSSLRYCFRLVFSAYLCSLLGLHLFSFLILLRMWSSVGGYGTWERFFAGFVSRLFVRDCFCGLELLFSSE